MTYKIYIILQIIISIGVTGCNISGKVTDLGLPMAGVTLTLSGNGIEKTTVTDQEGKYSFKSVPNGAYEVTPSHEGYIFFPRIQPIIQMGTNIIQVDFENFDTAFKSIALMSASGANFVKRGADLKMIAVGTDRNGKKIIVSEFLNWQSKNPDIFAIHGYSELTKLITGVSLGTALLTAETDTHYAKIQMEVRDQFYEDSDQIIPQLFPPADFPHYIGGCCIETCIWSVLNARGIQMSIEEIGAFGELHPEGWGLGSIEIVDVLEKIGIKYKITYAKKIETFTQLNLQTYEDILREKVIARVKAGVPVMFGMKYSPYVFNYLPFPMDHFVLAVGYNEGTDEIIYNDMNQVNRSTVTKLIDGSFGYTAINLFDVIWVVEFPNT